MSQPGDSAKQRRIARRREQRERQQRIGRLFNQPTQARKGGAHPPSEDEQNSSPYYAEKVERLLTLVDGDVPTLVALMFDVAHEEGLKAWSSKASGQRSLSQLLLGYNTLDWVMDLIDATEETFLRDDR